MSSSRSIAGELSHRIDELNRQLVELRSRLQELREKPITAKSFLFVPTESQDQARARRMTKIAETEENIRRLEESIAQLERQKRDMEIDNLRQFIPISRSPLRQRSLAAPAAAAAAAAAPRQASPARQRVAESFIPPPPAEYSPRMAPRQSPVRQRIDEPFAPPQEWPAPSPRGQNQPRQRRLPVAPRMQEQRQQAQRSPVRRSSPVRRELLAGDQNAPEEGQNYFIPYSRKSLRRDFPLLGERELREKEDMYIRVLGRARYNDFYEPLD